MANHPSRNELRSELRRQGLPRAYVTRLLAELDDHYEDLLEERSTSMGAARKLQLEQDDLRERLGEPAQLALFAAEQYHARSFWGRHPLATFVFGPLPLLVACWVGFWLLTVAFFLTTGCIDWLVTRVTGWSVTSITPDRYPQLEPWLESMVLLFISWALMVFPPLASANMLCRVATRNALPTRWPIIGCTFLALVAALLTVSWRLSTGPGTGLFMIGLDVGTSYWFLFRLVTKFALAMGIGLLLLKRAQQRLEIEG